MEGLKLTRPSQKLRAVQWVITLGLAMLSLAILPYGLREVSPVRADLNFLYVDQASGSDTTTCTTPANPCATISYALSQAEDGHTILVARGVYTENLVITKTVMLKGAYEPIGWTRCLRHCATTLDGNQSDRAIHIQTSLSETTVIDGFSITNANGGISTLLSLVAVENSKIIHNHTSGSASGGGMRIDRSLVNITNTLIADNTSAHNGGAMYIVSTGGQLPHSKVHIFNSTVVNNGATGAYNGIFCSLSSCTILNSILWGHGGDEHLGIGSITYSDIEMELPGEGNISAGPRFVDPTNEDYRLRSDSPCIDAGTSEDAPATDFEGDSRDDKPDLGFDEFKALTYLPVIFK